MVKVPDSAQRVEITRYFPVPPLIGDHPAHELVYTRFPPVPATEAREIVTGRMPGNLKKKSPSQSDEPKRLVTNSPSKSIII